MTRGIYVIFGLIAYLIFFATFLYLVGFVGNLPHVPLTLDRGPETTIPVALVTDMLLIAVFGVQHSVMARPAFKRSWTRIVPPPIERSVYVLITSLVLMLMFAFWRPMPGVVWQAEGALAWLLWGLFGRGWGIVLISTYLLSHWELFGLEQVWLNLRGKAAAAPVLRQPLFYKLVRHPLYTGFLLAFWAIPVMTAGHLVFVLGMSVYVFIAVGHEERDLTDLFGDEYRQYQREVGAVVPGVGRKR